MEYAVHTRQSIQAIAPSASHIIISICNPEDPRPRIPRTPSCHGVLELSFHDAIRLDKQRDNLTRFSRKDADAILGFWLEHQHVEMCIVHCDGGLCRSPAVAAALQKLEHGHDTPWFKTKRPNTFVYRALLEEGYRRGLNKV